MWKQVDDRKRCNFGECFLLKTILKRARARVPNVAGESLKSWIQALLDRADWDKRLGYHCKTGKLWDSKTGAGEFVEEQETSRTTEGTCGQDSAGKFGQA